MKMQDNTILITGGSSGIGRELARRFQALGNTVIVAGRDADRLDETIGDRADMYPLVFDQRDTADIQRFARRVIADHPALNVLVNNAGIMRLEGIAASRDLTDTFDTIAANLTGPIVLTDALVDHLSQQRAAAIVNVSSGLAFVPRPSAAVYSATKAAIHSYTVALRVQLAGKVKVIELVPPVLQTELTPGQSGNPNAYPLDAFIDEAMTLLGTDPTPPEILVQRVHAQRFAERDGTYPAVLARLSAL